MKIAVISFPGNNGDVENLRTLWRCGFDAFVFKWNDSKEMLIDVDGYFIGAGFSYEDRGRAGMVAGRDPIFKHLHEEAQKGKVILGCCNGAQVLVESELIPLGSGLKMSLARNVVEKEAVGFLNEWVWITPTCSRERCATSDWEGVMNVPIAHGEGRFTTKDKDVIEELKKNDQIAFSYCDREGNVSDKAPICPNGSLFGAAGICNPAGNVVALMPHPERSAEGDPYFVSMKRWIKRKQRTQKKQRGVTVGTGEIVVKKRELRDLEIFIDTIIVNNEERTVEQAARRVVSGLCLKQLKYLSPQSGDPKDILSHLSLFNPNKEIAFIKRGEKVTRWNPDSKSEEEAEKTPLDEGFALLRRDEPDTGTGRLGSGGQSGICYVCAGISEQELYSTELIEIFANPHASSLERFTS